MGRITAPEKVVQEVTRPQRIRPQTKRAAKGLGKMILGAIAASGVGIGTAWAAFGHIATEATREARDAMAREVREEAHGYTDLQVQNFSRIVDVKLEGVRGQMHEQAKTLKDVDDRSKMILWEIRRKANP